MIARDLIDKGCFGMRWGYLLLHPWEILGEWWRQVKWAWQRVFRGWDDRALWSLDYWLVGKMREMLPGMRDKSGIPSCCYDNLGWDNPSDEEDNSAIKKWHGHVDQMIDGFDAANEILDSDFPVSYEKSHERYHEGMKVFVEYMFALWN